MAGRRPSRKTLSVDEAFGRVVRSIRLDHGLSQESLALQSSSGRTFVSQLERGERGASLKTLFALATTLEVEPAEIVRMMQDELGSD